VDTKIQLGWLNLLHLPILLPPVTAKQQMVIIPGDQPEEGIDGYGGKDFQKRKVLRREWKISTTGAGSEHDDEEELGSDRVRLSERERMSISCI